MAYKFYNFKAVCINLHNGRSVAKSERSSVAVEPAPPSFCNSLWGKKRVRRAHAAQIAFDDPENAGDLGDVKNELEQLLTAFADPAAYKNVMKIYNVIREML